MKRRLLLVTVSLLVIVGLFLWDSRARAAALLSVNGAQVIVMTADEMNAALERARADGATKAKEAKCETI